MEFLLFLLFLCLTLLYLSIVTYYSRILFFYPKDLYNRDEIVSLTRAIPLEIIRLWEYSGNIGLSILVFLLGGLLQFLWSRIGGIVGLPHYTHSFGNYFFHFPLLFLAFTMTYSFWRSAYPEGITKYGYSLSVGLGSGSIAKALSSYGAYHEMYFTFSLLVIIIVSIIISFLWNRERFFGLELPGFFELNRAFNDNINIDNQVLDSFEELNE